MRINENAVGAKAMVADGFARSDGTGLWIDVPKPRRLGLWAFLKGFRTMARLEHVNMTVKDPTATAAMLTRIFGWRVRWHGAAINGGYTVHLGDDDTYLAIYSGPDETLTARGDQSYRTAGGLNHIGVVVDDLDAVEQKVRSEGLTPHAHADYEPGRRFYFDDHDGIEIEVISYS